MLRHVRVNVEHGPVTPRLACGRPCQVAARAVSGNLDMVSDKIKLMDQGTAISLLSRPESGAFVDDDVSQSQWRLGVDDDGHDVVAGRKRESQRPHRLLADP